jgi:hypothetical protein
MIKQILLGDNPRSTIIGAVAAGLLAIQTTLSTHPAHWYDWALAGALALFGRLAADSANSK